MTALPAALLTRQSHLASGEDPSSTEDQISRGYIGEEHWGYKIDPDYVFEEICVSGGSALDRRPGLLPALEALASGRIKVLVVTYLDRLVRDLAIQSEIVARAKASGGRILALDHGWVTYDSVSDWQTLTLKG